jgi:hypothetical protein
VNPLKGEQPFQTMAALPISPMAKILSQFSMLAVDSSKLKSFLNHCALLPFFSFFLF